MAYKLYKGSQLIKKIYIGSTMIKKIYKGNQLVWRADPYEPEQNVSYLFGPNIYSNILPKGVYDLILSGGGGTTGRWAFNYAWFYAKGGSGAVWEGQFYNPVDQQITLYAGNNQEDSYLDLGGVRMITAKAGTNADAWAYGHGGYGGDIEVNTNSLQIVQQRKAQKGNDGAFGTSDAAVFAASVCSINNWGQGAADQDQNGIMSGGALLKYVRLDK